MQDIVSILEKMNSITDYPLTLVDGNGRPLCSFPHADEEMIPADSCALVVEDFRLQKRDGKHPRAPGQEREE